VESTFNASGYDLATGGFTMGVDYRIGTHFAIGLTGGYAYTAADLVNNSNIAVNGGKLGTYATVFGSGFYLDTAVIGGLNGYDTNRTAVGGNRPGTRLPGATVNVLLAGGYDWKKGGFSIGPTASFQYTLIGFGAFTESGSLAPLAYPAQNAQSYRTALGMKTSYDWKIGPVHLVPSCGLPGSMNLGRPTTRWFPVLPAGRATASRSPERRSGATACCGSGLCRSLERAPEHVCLLRRRAFPHQLPLEQHLRGLSLLVLDDSRPGAGACLDQ
jgi:Uncharacterized protein with a C-terminal OMP (outer membrane protein) domain